MNKYIFISVIVALIVLLGGIWVYLLFNGTPDNATEVFSELGFVGNKAEETRTVVPNPETKVDVSDTKPLNQLTTRPVAGYIAIESASTSLVRYAERGTGHIYEINLFTGKERKLSGTTLSLVTKAVFSSDGKAVAITKIDGRVSTTYVGQISEDSENISYHSLPKDTDNHQFINRNELLFTINGDTGAVGYNYDLVTGATNSKFNLPVTDVEVHQIGAMTYYWPRPSPILKGALYELDSAGNGGRVTGFDYGFVAKPGVDDTWLTAHIDTQSKTQRSYILSNTGNEQELAIIMIPEKCDQLRVGAIWCAAPPILSGDNDYLYKWYRGELFESDALWKVDTSNGEATLVVQLDDMAGFAIDASEVQQTQRHTFFINRHNRALWGYTVQ